MKGGAQAPNLLVVEDDPFAQSMLAAYMDKAGYRVTAVGTGKEMFSILERRRFDLLFLDLSLPDEDGLVLARKVRASWPGLPIIVLSWRSDRDDRLTALDIGAEDYLTKPFDPEELLLRARNLLRRANGSMPDAPAETVEFRGWKLDFAGHALFRPDGIEVALTPGEFKLLAALARAPNRVLSRAQLLDATSSHSEAGERTIDVLVSTLRRKMEEDPRRPKLLVTVTGAGYKLVGVGARAEADETN